MDEESFFTRARCLAAVFVLRLTRGQAGNRTTTGSLSAPLRTTPYQLSHEETYGRRIHSGAANHNFSFCLFLLAGFSSCCSGAAMLVGDTMNFCTVASGTGAVQGRPAVQTERPCAAKSASVTRSAIGMIRPWWVDAHCLSSAPDKSTLPNTAQNCIPWNDGDVAIAFSLSMQNYLLANPNNVRTEPQSEICRNKKRAEMIFIQRSASLVGGLRCNVSRLLRMCWSRNEFRAGSLKRSTGRSGYLRSFSVGCGLSRRLLLTLVSSVANKNTYQQLNKQNNQTQKSVGSL